METDHECGAVFAAVFDGNVELCALLDRHGADWNTTFKGRAPLMDLMYFRRPAMAGWLSDHGADPNLRDTDGRTALHFAALQGVKNEHLAMLINNGAKPNLKDQQGNSPLDLAKSKKRNKAALFLQSL